LGGLKRLEYRGYDSAGVAVLHHNGGIVVERAVGKLNNLQERLYQNPLVGNIAIGHTRWATHGGVTENNAHPHVGRNGRVAVVHNGIIENYAELRQEMAAEGVLFTSETDTEVAAHLVDAYLAGGMDLLAAVQRALPSIQGASAFVFLSPTEPEHLVVTARLGNAGGIVLGIGDGETFIASDIPAILEHTRDVIFLESRQMARVSCTGVEIFRLDGTPVTPSLHAIAWDPVSAEKGPYRHFMQKEISEQPRAITDTIRGRVDFHRNHVRLESVPLTKAEAKKLDRIIIAACGSSYHAGLVGKFMIETLARVPVEVDYGSEFRYRNPFITPTTAVLAITQSGETVDTLAAMEEGRRQGAKLWSIVNVIGSQAQRLADGYISMQAGLEIGVATTKAFTASLVDLYLLALYLGELRDTLPADVLRQSVNDLARLPDLVGQISEPLPVYDELAEIFFKAPALPVPGPGDQLPRRVGRRAQAQGDLLHPRGRLSRRRDEARPHRPHRRGDARRHGRAARQRLRQDDQPDGAGESAQWHRHRVVTSGGHGSPQQGRSRARSAGHLAVSRAGAQHHPAAMAGLRDGRPAWGRCGPTEEFGQECDRRIT
jgi:glutamine---fructose-6-phosphate transaminase (isomerizing)